MVDLQQAQQIAGVKAGALLLEEYEVGGATSHTSTGTAARCLRSARKRHLRRGVTAHPSPSDSRGKAGLGRTAPWSRP
jgi:hypothetical protein